MFGKIALAAAVAAILAFSTAPSEAQRSSRLGAGGLPGGGVHMGGGPRGGGFGGARIGGFGGARIGGLGRGWRGGFVGPRLGVRHFGGPRFGIRTAGFGRPFVRPRFFPRRHFVRGAFIAPIVATGVYSCWRWRWTPWGWRRVWVCGPPPYGYYGAYYGYPY